jgi:hypothetical protein
VNVSATFVAAGSTGGGSGGGTGGPAGATNLDTSKTKGRQEAKKLKLKLTADQASGLEIGGKGKVAKRGLASTAAKTKNFTLKTKTGIQLQAGLKETIPAKIKKLLKGSKKARKKSKVVTDLTVTSALGVTTTSKLKIKLKL